MSDNSPSSGGAGDTISTDELLVLNGGIATGGQKMQRFKPSFGPDGEAGDVYEDNPLPVIDNEHALDLLTQIAAVLGSVMARGPTGAVPSLRVVNNSAGDLNCTATISGTPTINLTQVRSGSVSVANYNTGLGASGAPVEVLLGVAPTVGYHLPIVPQHLYSQIAG